MIIRAARLKDAPALGRVMVDTFMTAHQGQMPAEVLAKRAQTWTYEVSARAWERPLSEIEAGDTPDSCLYVAQDEAGQVVGLAMGCPAAQEQTGEVAALYVQMSHQGRGLGRRLVQAVAAHLAQRGMTGLIIGVLDTNAPARRFYEALGGRVVGERPSEDEGVMLMEVIYGWADIGVLVNMGENPSPGSGQTETP